MAVRAYWKGSLKLSLVSCPVLLYPASTSVDKTRFHMINRETGNRLKQQMDQDRVALARIVLTNREHVIAIEPLGKGLLGTTLRYPYELRDEDEYFDNIKTPKISKDMIELASHILDTKAAHFDPSKFKDEYESALKTLVRRKAAGKPVRIEQHAEKPGNVISLMDALKQSLKSKTGKHRVHSPTRRVRHGPAKKAHRSAARARKAS